MNLLFEAFYPVSVAGLGCFGVGFVRFSPSLTLALVRSPLLLTDIGDFLNFCGHGIIKQLLYSALFGHICHNLRAALLNFLAQLHLLATFQLALFSRFLLS